MHRSHIETGDALIEGIHAADDEIIEKEARLAELDREIEAAEARLADKPQAHRNVEASLKTLEGKIAAIRRQIDEVTAPRAA